MRFPLATGYALKRCAPHSGLPAAGTFNAKKNAVPIRNDPSRPHEARLINEPITTPRNIVELLAQWRQDEPLGPEDQFPETADLPLQPEFAPFSSNWCMAHRLGSRSAPM